MFRGAIFFVLISLWPIAGSAQDVCAPLQGTDNHAACLSAQLAAAAKAPATQSPAIETDPLMLHPVAPPVANYLPGFAADQAAAHDRLKRNTDLRTRALSNQIGQSLSAWPPPP